MQKLSRFTLLFSISLASFNAFSVDSMDQNPSEQSTEFKALDSNNDGKLTATEAQKDPFYKKGIAAADKNGNKSLSEDEYRTYKSKEQQKENKQAAKDSAITTKIKSKYLVEKNFKSFKVSVETKDQMVLLSGFVPTQAQKTRAEEIAKKVKGVKSVKNAIVVKP